MSWVGLGVGVGAVAVEVFVYRGLSELCVACLRCAWLFIFIIHVGAPTVIGLFFLLILPSIWVCVMPIDVDCWCSYLFPCPGIGIWEEFVRAFWIFSFDSFGGFNEFWAQAVP